MSGPVPATAGSRALLHTSDLHWLAGLLEGEGYFGMRGAAPCIDVAMSDLDVVTRASSLLRPGGRIYIEKPKPNRKQTYRAAVTGGPAAGWMMTLWSLLGTRRRARIAEVLKAWKARPLINKSKTACIRGHVFDEANTYQYRKNHRMCKACARERNLRYMRRVRRAQAS